MKRLALFIISIVVLLSLSVSSFSERAEYDIALTGYTIPLLDNWIAAEESNPNVLTFYRNKSGIRGIECIQIADTGLPDDTIKSENDLLMAYEDIATAMFNIACDENHSVSYEDRFNTKCMRIEYNIEGADKPVHAYGFCVIKNSEVLYINYYDTTATNEDAIKQFEEILSRITENEQQ